MCARACVFRHYFANLTTLSVCLPVHTVTHTHTHTQATLKTQANTCQVRIENPSFVLKGGNTIAHPHKHTHQGTHCICGRPWKASSCTDVIPLPARSSVPACVGQEPVRTSGAPALSPLKLQPPKATVHVWDCSDRRCRRGAWDSAGRRYWCDISRSGNLRLIERSSLNRDLPRMLAAG
jgi:hypothetical protein